MQLPSFTSTWTYHQYGNDQPEQSDGASKDLDDEDLDKERGIGGIGQSCPGSDLADAETAHQVGESGGQARAEHEVAAGPVARLHGRVIVGQ